MRPPLVAAEDTDRQQRLTQILRPAARSLLFSETPLSIRVPCVQTNTMIVSCINVSIQSDDQISARLILFAALNRTRAGMIVDQQQQAARPTGDLSSF